MGHIPRGGETLRQLIIACSYQLISTHLLSSALPSLNSFYLRLLNTFDADPDPLCSSFHVTAPKTRYPHSIFTRNFLIKPRTQATPIYHSWLPCLSFPTSKDPQMSVHLVRRRMNFIALPQNVACRRENVV